MTTIEVQAGNTGRDAAGVLKAVFGFEGFLGGQREVVDQLLAGRSELATRDRPWRALLLLRA